MFQPKKSCYPPVNIDIDSLDESAAICNNDIVNYEATKNWSRITTETIEERLQRYLDYFTVPVSYLQSLVDEFEHELILGLKIFKENRHTWQARKCSFKMLDACVEKLPSGDEKDFGGTNFRVVRAVLSGKGKCDTKQLKSSLAGAQESKSFPKGLLDKRATATKMFDFFANCSKTLMQQEGDLILSSDESNDIKKEDNSYKTKNPISTCFTFSFPCSQHQINSAHLMEWTKGFETGRATKDPVEGLDVVQLMEAGYNRLDVPLRLTGVINDTVGTLLSAAYDAGDNPSQPPCLVGMILGTGVNACFYETQAPSYGYKGRIINIECGNFNRDLPLTNLDFIEESNRGRQRLEKMIAGAYLGELCRRATVKVLQNLAPEAAWKRGSMSCTDVNAIVSDTSENLEETAKRLKDMWNYQFDNFCLNVIRQLCRKITDRAAALSVVIIAGASKKTKHLQPAMGGLTVAIDGSLYKEIIYFKQRIRHYLNAVLGEATANLIHLIEANDGSGKGAAILAACLDQ